MMIMRIKNKIRTFPISTLGFINWSVTKVKYGFLGFRLWKYLGLLKQDKFTIVENGLFDIEPMISKPKIQKNYLSLMVDYYQPAGDANC